MHGPRTPPIEVMTRTTVGTHTHGLGGVASFPDHMAIM